MSEYQHIAFRAIDRPVSEQNLQYMRRQSTRATITPWSFENEYHYGDFHGNPMEMLRLGYDIHLHYANFGIRKLLIRLPHGLPDSKAAQPYLGKDAPRLLKDKVGTGVILAIEPFHEPGDLDEIWEVSAVFGRLVPLRAEILNGNLRPLYLAYMAIACDMEHDPEETVEAPVPAGLEDLSEAQRSLAELYGLSDDLIAAAAQEAPAMPASAEPLAGYSEWLCDQPATMKDGWLAAWMADTASSARVEILAKYRADSDLSTWPTARPNRTVAQLQAAAAKIADEAKQRAAADATLRRTQRLAKMATNPAATLREIEKLVSTRTTVAYRRVAELLSELREVLSGSEQSDLAEKYAQKLKSQNPTLRMLTSELRRQGFVPNRCG
ncbi:MAG: hypothetical protein JSS27_02375 [Planctomycetes bacterium]|nr:hypothetical protein [Planctomycetota bacterium]